MKKIAVFMCTLTCFVFFITAEPVLPEQLKKVAHKKGRPSVALVLAGGGAKGYVHIPILQMIEDIGIPIDIVIGTSAGSIVGGLYAAGYTPQEIADNLLKLNWSPLFSDVAVSPYESILGDHSLYANPISLTFGLDFSLQLGKGFSNGQNVYQLFKKMTIKLPSYMNFDDLSVPFRAVATNMLSGEALVLQDGDVAEAIRSSMSIPGVFQPFKMDGMYYVDGGLRYNLPINVAAAMGYDIIIAVDISDKVLSDPEKFNSNPAVALLQINNITQTVVNADLYKDAALIIHPNLHDYNMLSFKNAQQIYDIGIQTAQKYKPDLESIHKKIYPEQYSSDGKRLTPYAELRTQGTYDAKKYQIPQSIDITDAIPRDIPYIQTAFEKIKGKEFDTQNFSIFMNSIYLTGNYINAIVRMDSGSDKPNLKLILIQKPQKEAKLVLGVDFEGTIGSNTMSKILLTAEGQFRGLTGIGSILSLRFTTVSDFGVELFYLQPFNPYFFFQFSSIFYFDKQTIIPSFTFDYPSVQLLTTSKSNMLAGFKTNNGSLIKTGGFFTWGQASDFLSALFGDQNLLYYVNQASGNYDTELKNFMSAGARFSYTFDSQHPKVFPTNGIYLNAAVNEVVPVNPAQRYSYLATVCSIDFHSAFPIGKHVSLIPSFFAGSDVTKNLLKTPGLIITDGFNVYDRTFFPQVSSRNRYGIYKGAIALTVQIHPFKTLTILGGDIIFQINGTLGNVGYDIPDMFTFSYIENTYGEKQSTPALWSSSLGIGLRIKETYSVLLRAGVGSTPRSSFTPFISLDIGSIRY